MTSECITTERIRSSLALRVSADFERYFLNAFRLSLVVNSPTLSDCSSVCDDLCLCPLSGSRSRSGIITGWNAEGTLSCVESGVWGHVDEGPASGLSAPDGVVTSSLIFAELESKDRVFLNVGRNFCLTALKMSDGRIKDGAAGWAWTLALANVLITGLSTLLDFLKNRLFSFAVGSICIFGLLGSATFNCSSKDTVDLNSDVVVVCLTSRFSGILDCLV